MASPNTPAAGEAGDTNGKRSKAPIIFGVLALVALAWGGKTMWYNRNHVTTDNAQVDGTIVPVLAKVGGYVMAVRVAENQAVKGGELLVNVDSAEYAVKLAQAEADYAATVAVAGDKGGTNGQARAQIGGAMSQLEVVRAQVEAAGSAQERATADYARTKELYAKQIVARQQLDAARAAAEQADANLRAVQRQQAVAGTQIESAKAGERLAVARLAAARAARDNAALQLAWTRVVAPLAGSVSRKQVEVGQLVQAGQPLLTIVADTSAFIMANFKETQLADLKAGQPVNIEVDSYPGCNAEGKVESVSAATGARFALLPPDNSTGNFTKVVQRVPVRIQVTKGCGPTRPMRPGMSVIVHVTTA